MKHVPIPLELAFYENKEAKEKQNKQSNDNLIDDLDETTYLPIIYYWQEINKSTDIFRGEKDIYNYSSLSNLKIAFKTGDIVACWKNIVRRARLFIWIYKHYSLPKIKSIQRDKLIVSAGIDTCCVFHALGRSWINVSMEDNVYELWNQRSISKLEAIVEDTGRKGFYNPVLHEKYRKALISRSESVRLDRIRLILGTLGNGLTGLDIGCNMGYMCHHLARIGFIMTGIDYDDKHLAVAEALNETYDLDVNFLNISFSDYNIDKQYDIVIALTVLYHMIFRNKDMDPEIVTRKVGQLTRNVLIWESGDSPDKEKEIILKYSGLTEYLSLGNTEGTGLRREMGVFLRPGSAVSKYIHEQYRNHFCS